MINFDYTSEQKEIKEAAFKFAVNEMLPKASVFDQTDKCLAHGTSKMMVAQGLQTIKSAIDFMGADPLPPKLI